MSDTKATITNWLEYTLGGYLEEIESIEKELTILRAQRMKRSETDSDETKRLRRLAIEALENRKVSAQTDLGIALWNLITADKLRQSIKAAEIKHD